MANKKISQLESAVDVTASDLIQIVDVEDNGMAYSGTNKKCTAQLLANELGDLTSITSTGSSASRKLVDRFADVVNVKDFGADPTGTTDSTVAIQNAINTGKTVIIPSGTYLVSSTIRSLNNVALSLIGEPKKTTIKATGSISSIIAGPASLLEATSKIYIYGIIFDGQHSRTSFPYSSGAGTYGAVTALSFTANPDDSDSEFILDFCNIVKTPSLPFIVDHFKRASVTRCSFIKTKDAGFRFCDSVTWSNNVTRFGADNGVSVSRGCTKAIISDSVFEDVEVSGVWVSGFNVNGSGNLTLSGASYTAGSTLTMAATNGASFSLKDKYVFFTLYDISGNECTVKVTSIASNSSCTVIALDNVPAALQNAASDSWKYAPHEGVDSFVVSNCIIDGAYSTGLHAGISPSSGIFGNCVVQRSGYIADSEVHTTGSIVSGSSSLVVASASNFSASDWVVIKSQSGLQHKFTAKILSKSDNTLTLDRNADFSYVGSIVYKCHINNTEGWGAYISGNGTGQQSFAENMSINNCSFISGRGNDIHIGNSTLTSAKKICVKSCNFTDPYSLKKSTADGLVGNIRISEPSGYEVSDIVIQNNYSDLTLGSGKSFVTAYIRGTSSRSIIITDNYIPNGADQYYVNIYDADNSNANITDLYSYSWTDSKGINISKNNKSSNWYSLTAGEISDIASTGILYPKSSRISIDPSSSLTINSIDWSLLGSNGLPECHVENASTINDITFTHNDASIRCPNNTSVVLQPRDYAAFGKRNSTVSYKLM